MLRLLAQGKENAEIAKEMQLAGNTVASRLVVIYRLMGIKGRVSAARMYWEWEQEQKALAS